MPGQFVDSIINENLKVATEYFKATIANLKENPNSGGAIGFIPFKIGCTMDGFSGIKIYNELIVNTNFLPLGYLKTTRFIVTGVDHKLSNGDWETTLNMILIPKTNNIETIKANIVPYNRAEEKAPVKKEEKKEKDNFSFTKGTFHENLIKIAEHERELFIGFNENNLPSGHGSYNPTPNPNSWSGRFISWCVNTAGEDIWSSTTPRFGDYQRHSAYSNKAKINRRDDIGYFKAYKYDETPVQVGDILVYSHDGGTWDDNGYDTSYKGHGDICVKIESGYAWCIGGNLGDTVKYAKYKLTSTNFLQVGGSGGKEPDFYTGQNRLKGKTKDVFQTIIRFNLP